MTDEMRKNPKKKSADVQRSVVWEGDDVAGILNVQDLLLYYAKCHETPFCMRDQLMWMKRGRRAEREKRLNNGGD